jgi:hypothetical protein
VNRDYANRLLDAVRSGKQDTRISSKRIREALMLTGDYQPAKPIKTTRKMPNYGETRYVGGVNL